ncbi:MAG: TRAP transporter substrate-binding protein [Chloroflexi bacterium]|nr:TRAP transporter substrate-binding protein [Chloroflexota bacterium]
MILRIGHQSGAKSIQQAVAVKLAEGVKQRTQDRVRIDVFPEGQLGNESAMLQAALVGTQELVLLTSPMATLAPKFSVNDLPFVFSSTADAYKAWDGKMGRTIAAEIESKGMKYFGTVSTGFRSTLNTKRAINTVADVTGLKMRTAETPVIVDMFKALGAQPIVMAFSEVESAVRQGLVDGLEVSPDAILTLKSYEYNKFLSLTEHVFNTTNVLMSQQVFTGLPKDVQVAITASAANAVKEGRVVAEELDKKATADLEKLIQLNRVPDKKPFKDKMASLYSQWEPKLGADLIQAAIKLEP